MIVKRLVSIEDLGNIEVFFTDKTGTLTEGRISFAAALDTDGRRRTPCCAVVCSATTPCSGRPTPVGGNPLDQALWEAPAARGATGAATAALADRPFDYERRLASVLVEAPDGHAPGRSSRARPRRVLARCRGVAPEAQRSLDAQFAAGSRVIAVATRAADGRTTLTAEDESELELAGFLTFLDRPKADAADALARLARARRRGQGDHRRQRPRRPQGLRRSRPRRARRRSPGRSSTARRGRSSPPRCRGRRSSPASPPSRSRA